MRALVRPFLASLTLLALAGLAGCGGRGNVGEGCRSPGSTEDCSEGAICTTDRGEVSRDGTTWVSSTCRTICSSSTQCEDGFECRGVAGASLIGSCQPIPAE